MCVKVSPLEKVCLTWCSVSLFLSLSTTWKWIKYPLILSMAKILLKILSVNKERLYQIQISKQLKWTWKEDTTNSTKKISRGTHYLPPLLYCILHVCALLRMFLTQHKCRWCDTSCLKSLCLNMWWKKLKSSDLLRGQTLHWNPFRKSRESITKKTP